MFTLNLDILPKKILNEVTYILYYILNFYFVFFISYIIYGILSKNIITDYYLFIGPIVLSIPCGRLRWCFTTPLEYKIIDRNLFIAWIINILKHNDKISYKDIINDNSFMLILNKNNKYYKNIYVKYIFILAALDILNIESNDQLVKLSKWNLSEEFIVRNIEKLVLSLIDKNIDIDKLLIRFNNYFLK